MSIQVNSIHRRSVLSDFSMLKTKYLSLKQKALGPGVKEWRWSRSGSSDGGVSSSGSGKAFAV